MLTPDQINTIHRLHLVEKWPLRKIARHLKIGRRTLGKYIETPAPPPPRRDRVSKLDSFKSAINELLERDPTAPATVIAERIRTLGFDGGITIVKDYVAGWQQLVHPPGARAGRLRGGDRYHRRGGAEAPLLRV